MPNLLSPVDDAQVSLVDQRLQRLLEKRAQVLVYGTHFQEHDGAFVEQLCERIGQWNGRHVACSQDDDRFRRPRAAGAVVCGELIVEIIEADAVSHPGGHFEREQREAVVQDTRWQQGNAESPVWSLVRSAGKSWDARCFDSSQRVNEQPQKAQSRHGTGEDFLGSVRAAGRYRLGSTSRVHPLRRNFRHSFRTPFCERDSLANRGLCVTLFRPIQFFEKSTNLFVRCVLLGTLCGRHGRVSPGYHSGRAVSQAIGLDPMSGWHRT